VLSLDEKAQRTINQKQTIYDAAQLDDEALQLILKPKQKVQVTN
jgi:hypothetical protein